MKKVGKNAYPFTNYNKDTQSVEFHSEVTVTGTAEKYEVAVLQTHNSYEARPVVHEYTLEEFTKDPKVLMKERGKEIEEFTHLPWIEEGKEAKEPVMNP